MDAMRNDGKETPLVLATSAALMEMEYFDHDASGVFVSSSSMSIPHADKSLIQMPSFSYDSDLAFKLTGDILVAVSITFGVSPILSVIDKAIVQKAAGTHSILQSSLDTTVNIARNPGNFIKSPVFLAMWGVYAATYSIGEFSCSRVFQYIYSMHCTRMLFYSFLCSNTDRFFVPFLRLKPIV